MAQNMHYHSKREALGTVRKWQTGNPVILSDARGYGWLFSRNTLLLGWFHSLSASLLGRESPCLRHLQHPEVSTALWASPSQFPVVSLSFRAGTPILPHDFP